MPLLSGRLRRAVTSASLGVALTLSAASAGLLAASQPAQAAHAYTATDARTALNAFMSNYYRPADGLWKNDLTGGVATMWDADYVSEGMCVANEVYGGAYRQQLIDLFYGLERISSDTRTWTETIDGVTRTTTTDKWWYLEAWNDDLLWTVNASICAYEQTGDRHMLDVAELHTRWMLETQIDNRAGFGDWGMWHNSNSIGDYKDISTTGQVPYIALKLAKYFPNRTIRNNATGQDLTYRDYATRTYDWMRSFIRPDGSIINGTNGTGTGFYDNDHYMMNVGLIDDSAAALYRETGDPKYISDAVRITDWARNRFTINYNGKQILWPQWTTSNGGAHYNQWVDSDEGINTVAKGIMARGILHLVEYAGQTQYLQWMEDNAQTAWDNRHLSDNLLYTNWQVPNTLPAKSVSYGNFTGVDIMQRIAKVQTNPIFANAGFETDNPGTTTPFGWSTNTFGNTANDGASFTEAKGSAAHSGNAILTHYKNSAYQTYTYQTLTGLRNGTYTLRAWARSTGGQTASYLQWMEDNAQTAWDNRHLSDNLLYTNWQVPNTLPAKSVSYGNFTGVDIMQRIAKVQTNPIFANAGFETDNPGTTTPFGWSTNTFGNTANDGASFTEAKGSAAHSGNAILTHYKNSAYQTYTYQTLTGLRNGTYTLRAWARSTGGQTASYLGVKDYGSGTELTADLRGTGTGGWQQVTIPNVAVTNGKATIGVYSNAAAGQWTNIDDIQFTPPAVVNPYYSARNLSFEDNNAATTTPANWSTYNFGNTANDAASFAEYKGGDARSGNYILAHYKSTPYQVYTYQTFTGLPNGTYNLSLRARSTGGQTASYVGVKDYGGTAELTADLRGTGTGGWQLVTINDIAVTNGQATVGFYSNAAGGQWTNIDDINFARH